MNWSRSSSSSAPSSRSSGRVWDARVETLEGGRVGRVAIQREGLPISYGDVLELWRCDNDFGTFFTSILAEAPYSAYLWETPPINRMTTTRSFEFVLVDSPVLAGMSADHSDFAEPFKTAGSPTDVAVFANLGGDAVLVSPRPLKPDDAYTHLAAFARTAPATEAQAFWRALAEAVISHLSDRSLWISTNGLGVPWLHARLDSRPKYYSFGPYRKISP